MKRGKGKKVFFYSLYQLELLALVFFIFMIFFFNKSSNAGYIARQFICHKHNFILITIQFGFSS